LVKGGREGCGGSNTSGVKMDAEVEADTGLAKWGSGKVGLELGIGKGGGGTPGRGKANLLTEFQAGLGEGYGSLTGKLGGGY